MHETMAPRAPEFGSLDSAAPVAFPYPEVQNLQKYIDTEYIPRRNGDIYGYVGHVGFTTAGNAKLYLAGEDVLARLKQPYDAYSLSHFFMANLRHLMFAGISDTAAPLSRTVIVPSRVQATDYEAVLLHEQSAERLQALANATHEKGNYADVAFIVPAVTGRPYNVYRIQHGQIEGPGMEGYRDMQMPTNEQHAEEVEVIDVF